MDAVPDKMSTAKKTLHVLSQTHCTVEVWLLTIVSCVHCWTAPVGRAYTP